jgi:hypothetical protein
MKSKVHAFLQRLSLVTGAALLATGCIAQSEPAPSEETGEAKEAMLTNCHFGGTVNGHEAYATCTETVELDWWIQADCEYPSGRIVTVNGQLEFGPGQATSIVYCPVGTSAGAVRLIEHAP